MPRRGDNAAADAVEHCAGPVCAVAHHGAGPRGRAGVCGAGHGGDRCGGHHCGRHHDCAGGAARYGRLFDRRAAGRVGRCLGCDGRDGLYRVGAHRLHCADGGLHGAGRCAQHGRGHCGGHQRAAVGHRTCQKHGGQRAGQRGQAGQQPKCAARAGLRGVGAGPGAGAGGGHPAEPAVFGDAR